MNTSFLRICLGLILALGAVQQASAGLITRLDVNPAGGGISGTTTGSGSSFWVDVFVRHDGTATPNQVGYFNLQLNIATVSGTTNGLSFAAINNQLAEGGNDFQTAGNNYIFGNAANAGRNTNSLFFSNRNATGTSIQITDGLKLDNVGGNPNGNPIPSGQVTLTGAEKLLARVLVSSAVTQTSQFNITVGGNALIVDSAVASNQTGVAPPVLSFNLDRFGYWQTLAQGDSYGTLGVGGTITPFNAGLQITAVPEPSSMALLGVVAVAGVGFRLRKRFGRKVA